MDEETALVLGVQLLALCCIACSLVLYLLRKMSRKAVYSAPALRSVLVTSCETSVGLQLCDRLAAVGFRVFAGYKPDGRSDAADSISDCASPSRVAPSGGACALLRLRAKQRESAASDAERAPGGVVFVPLDVTREDSLHEAVVTIKRHLPAGEDGLWAVISTADVCLKGRIEMQESAQWEILFKTNVFGTLKAARTFYPLLVSQKGRLINFGTSKGHPRRQGMTAFDSARHAVAGASMSLREDLRDLDVHVIVVNTNHIQPENLFEPIRSSGNANEQNNNMLNEKYPRPSLPEYAVHTILDALLEPHPKPVYAFEKPSRFTCNSFSKKTLSSERNVGHQYI
ncbi:NAD(P)-binding domain,Short-chain dehydrogenase/reductase SDR [Cinara cedri]|uniref:NAD(P)-binding domain,Short-chain dehydrogenase/reductase SDR n=1 Tax=Cinara cedri TaxID=506608 RepID=A0A5E4M426_9HEMI|nr:NAD(P)-binding domain,Short-chain dehydrogenase/reductase SDR [Cinara cedri]